MIANAVFTNDVASLKVLLATDRLGLKQHMDHSLLYAVRHGALEVAQFLLRHGASLETKSAIGQTVWSLAKQSPDPEETTAFLEKMKSLDKIARENFSSPRPDDKGRDHTRRGMSPVPIVRRRVGCIVKRSTV